MFIGALARELHINIQTLRYYERIGLIVPERSESGYREYNDIQAENLRFIKRAQSLGFTLEEIKKLLQVRTSAELRHAGIRDEAEEKLRHIDAKIQLLQEVRQELHALLSACMYRDNTADCPIIEHIESNQQNNSIINYGETMEKTIEVFSAGCSICSSAIERLSVQTGQDVTVLDMMKPDIAERAEKLGVKKIPAVVVNGELAACCNNDIDLRTITS